MSYDIDDAFVKQYEAEVHEAYQRMGSKLMGTIRTVDGVVGESATFQKVGKGVASTKTRHGEVPLMNADHTPVTATLADYYAGDYVDRLDELKIKHQERAVVARAGAFALGRKTDDIIITAMDTATAFVGDYSTGFTRKLMLDVLEKFNSNDAPNDGQRFAALASHAWGEFLNLSEVKSADFMGVDGLPWKTGPMVKEVLGIKWMEHSGLPLASTDDRTCFAWHRSSVGLAIGTGVTADIQWVGNRAAWFVNHFMSMGAVLIDANGCFEIRVDDDAAYS